MDQHRRHFFGFIFENFFWRGSISLLAMSAKYWCWTLNNYNDEELEALASALSTCTYYVYGKEVGQEGTPHLQGYMELPNRAGMLTCREMFTNKGIRPPHLEVRRGSSKQAIIYCKKDGDFVEVGEPNGQGKRSDLDEVVAAISDGASLHSLWKDFPVPMIRYSGGITKLFNQISPTLAVPAPLYTLEDYPALWRLSLAEIGQMGSKSIILWGSSGVGKTSFARAALPTALIVSHMDDLLSFNPDIHEGIIFDDMDFRHLPRTSQIHLFDRDLPRSIHCRYATALIPARTKKIFTTNEHEGCIALTSDPAIRRRISIHRLALLQELIMG